jgi:DNA-directed RNA polymerase specialized sigma subunit
MIGSRRHYARFITDGIGREIRNPFRDVKYGLLLGDESFVKIMRAECIEEGSKREQPSYRELVVENIEPQRVIECVAEVYGVQKNMMLDYYGNSELRGIVSELLYRYSDVTQAEIGNLLGGISYSGVSRLRHRLQRKLKTNPQTQARYNETEKRLRKLSIVKT